MIFNRMLGYSIEQETTVSRLLYHVFYLALSISGVYFACKQIKQVFKTNKSRPDLLV